MSHIYFDIETGPAANAREFCVEPKDKRNKSIEDQLADAALSAITGRVLVVAVQVGNTAPTFYEGDEKQLLSDFWRDYRAFRGQSNAPDWVGFNIADFDLPFLIRRSWVNAVKPPPCLNERGYMLPHFIDLRDVWGCGQHQPKGGLDVIARLMGLPGKTSDGAGFAELYAKDREAALAYAAADLAATKAVAERLL